MKQRLDRLTRWLRSPRESIRLEAVTELENVPIDTAAPLLLSAISDTSSVVRATAAWILWRSTDKRAVTALRPLLNDPDEHVRASAAWSLSHIGGKAILPEIIPLCRDDASGIVRFRAVWGLAIIGDKSALPVAVDALSDYNPAVRERSALLALDALADDTLGDRLVKQAKNEYPPTRRVVMYLFSRYGDGKRVVPVLQERLSDAEALVRAEAALSLGKRRAESAVSSLLPLLKDPDEHVRGATAYALGLIGNPSTQVALRLLLKDETAFVRAVAAESLRRLGDKSAKPPDGFKGAELFTFPIYSPEHTNLYR